jgi:hypothetical protein
MDRRKAKPMSARLSTTGYLRLSSDLVPVNARELDLKFVITPMPSDRTLVLKIVTNGTDGFHARRKAQYANRNSKCPVVTVKSALQFMGIPFPKKSTEYPVRKRKDCLLIKF